jgi:arginyl-tRNA synthetase
MTLKSSIADLVAEAVTSIPELAQLPDIQFVTADVERTRDPRHGDFATNVAMRLAKSVGKNPRELATEIIAKLPQSELVTKAEIAGPGFINFHVGAAAFHQEVRNALKHGQCYGRLEKKTEPRILLEFVSANPTGPLHVGHGRHAAFGATLGNLLEAAGYSVDREYYVNDAGRQMDILGLSVWLRSLQTAGLEVPFPDAGYKGDYIRDIAAALDMKGVPAVTAEQVTAGLPADAPAGDKEVFISTLIERANELLGEDKFLYVRQQSLESIRDEIREDLAEFGVEFNRWYSEQSLEKENLIDEALAVLKERRMLYVKDGATWFRATDYGDEKDRVVIRDNGKKTYFASDIAYHYHKRKRGYDLLLDILGADHHGYVARVRAGLEAMGYAGDSLEVELVQFVTLYRAGEKMSMSTRSGEFVTLRQLREEVGNDAARFFYVMRSNDQHLDFDLELAKSRSQDNPVYYIQYAHARVCSVFRQLEEKGMSWDEQSGAANLGKLDESHERALMTSISRYSEVIELAAMNRAPQLLVNYLREIATEFQAYYNAHKFIVDDDATRNARLALISAVRSIIASGLAILGVSAPEAM